MKNDVLKKLLPFVGLPVVGIAFLILQWDASDVFYIIRTEILLIVVYVVSWIDFKEKKVPNRLILILLGLWVFLVVLQFLLQTENAFYYILNGGFGLLISGGIFFFVYLISRKGLGGGDVKLMAVLGLYLGIDGSFTTLFWGSIISALVILILIAKKKIGKKDAIPLVPFLYIGMLLYVFCQ